MKQPTLVFDLDGTLVDTAPDLAGATNHALAEQGLSAVDPESVRKNVSFGASAIIAHALDLSDHDADETLQETMLRDFLAFYGDNIANESRPYPGVVDMLEKFQKSGARLAVCTNKRENLSRRLLKALALDGYFHAVTGRDTLPVHKPDPAHLLGTVIIAKGNLDRTVMIGDSKTDLDTARAAGMPFIGVSFGYSDIPMAVMKPDALIDHFGEFESALKTIADQRKQTGAEY